MRKTVRPPLLLSARQRLQEGGTVASFALCRTFAIGAPVRFDICTDRDSADIQCGVDVGPALERTLDIRHHAAGGMLRYLREAQEARECDLRAKKRIKTRQNHDMRVRELRPHSVVRSASQLFDRATTSEKQAMSARSMRLIYETKSMVKTFKKLKKMRNKQ